MTEQAANMLQLMDSEIADIATTIPAIVLRYNLKKQVADVELVVKRPYFGNDEASSKSIRLLKVPVIFPQGNDWVMAGPLKRGDAVLIHCSMFDCETWLTGDKATVYQAGSLYYHDLNSSFATIGAFTYNSTTIDQRFVDKFHIVQGNNYITMDSSGGVHIEAGGGNSHIHMDQTGNIIINTLKDTIVNSNKTTINNNTEIIGNLEVTGKIESPTIKAGSSLKVDEREVLGHNHNNGDNTPF